MSKFILGERYKNVVHGKTAVVTYVFKTDDEKAIIKWDDFMAEELVSNVYDKWVLVPKQEFYRYDIVNVQGLYQPVIVCDGIHGTVLGSIDVTFVEGVPTYVKLIK